jgi:hypothetical protein
MAVSETMVSYVTGGRYAPTSQDATYVYEAAVAAARLNAINPGLPTALYDHCHALMIAHLHFSTDPVVGMRSFSTGDFSGSQDPGMTVYLRECQQIIADYQISDSQNESVLDTTRCDAVMPDFKIDQSDLPVFYRETGSDEG